MQVYEYLEKIGSRSTQDQVEAVKTIIEAEKSLLYAINGESTPSLILHNLKESSKDGDRDVRKLLLQLGETWE